MSNQFPACIKCKQPMQLHTREEGTEGETADSNLYKCPTCGIIMKQYKSK